MPLRWFESSREVQRAHKAHKARNIICIIILAFVCQKRGNKKTKYETQNIIIVIIIVIIVIIVIAIAIAIAIAACMPCIRFITVTAPVIAARGPALP